ncbi:MAG: mechanosensitive ion channel family protein [Myxococcota bacterium]|nr:mechanosensitive ion channel family protein [Myxococcota bacterium]
MSASPLTSRPCPQTLRWVGPARRVWCPFGLGALRALLIALACALVSSLARAEPPSSDVRLHGKAVFALHAPRAGVSAQERASAAGRALETVVDDPEQPTARVEEQENGPSAVVFVGKTPVVTLGSDDAVEAGGEATLHVYAASIASKIDVALRAERKRSAIATSVFSVSLLVFSAVLAFLLFRRVGDLSARARVWVKAHPELIPALRLGHIEVVGPIAVRGALSIALALAHRLAQFTVVYSWLIFALSRFDATRDYTGRLAGFVLVPLSALIGRVGAALPLVVVAAIASVALVIAVRFVTLFFGALARGETQVPWLPRDLAGPTSVLVRAGMVLVSIVLAAPLITGTDDGALSRAGVVALVALGLACTPLLACAVAGVPAVYGRRFKPGDYVEVGGRAGVVRDMTLLELVLEDTIGCQVRVPQLLGLWHPTRVLGSGPLATIEVAVDPRERPAKVEAALVGAAVATCERARVELFSIDAEGARWRVCGIPKHGKGAAALADAVAQAVAEQGIALGGGSSGARVPGR